MKKFYDFKVHSYVIKAEFSPSPRTHLDPICGKSKMKFKNLSPGNRENLFALSF